MSQLQTLLNKIPTPLLVFSILVISIGLMVYNNPLKKGCEVEIDNFARDMRGVVIDTRDKKKNMVVSTLKPALQFCRNGNSAGACEDYFRSLNKFTDSVMLTKSECLVNLANDEKYEKVVLPVMKEGLRVLSLLAWGSKPPSNVTERTGWLTIREVSVFCRLSSKMEELVGAEELDKIRNSVFAEYPDAMDERMIEAGQSFNEEERKNFARPRALRSASNPQGSLNANEIFERSLFSIRCENYQ